MGGFDGVVSGIGFGGRTGTADGNLVAGCICMVATEDPIMAATANGDDPRYSGRFRDDVIGQLLRDDLVREARLQELRYFAEKGVRAKVPIAEARRRTG